MRFPNRIYGEEAAPYTYHDEQQFPLGQVMELPNGRLFRYARPAAAASAANKLYQSEVPEANWDTCAVKATVVAGASIITYVNGATGVTENELSEGTIIVESAAALGHIYPIKTNIAEAGGGSGTGSVTLMDGVTVQVGLTTSHKVTVVKSPWADIIIKPTSAQTALLVGVPAIVAPVGACQWICSHGVCSILIDATPVIGQVVRSSEDDAGAVALHDFDEGTSKEDAGYIGWSMEIGGDGVFGHVFLTLD